MSISKKIQFDIKEEEDVIELEELYKYSLLEDTSRYSITEWKLLNLIREQKEFKNEFDVLYFGLPFFNYLRFESKIKSNEKVTLSSIFIGNIDSSKFIIRYFNTIIYGAEVINLTTIDEVINLIYIYLHFFVIRYLIKERKGEFEKALKASGYKFENTKIIKSFFLILINTLYKQGHISKTDFKQIKPNINIILNSESIEEYKEEITRRISIFATGENKKRRDQFPAEGGFFGLGKTPRKYLKWYEIDYNVFPVISYTKKIKERIENSFNSIIQFIVLDLYHSPLTKYYIFKTLEFFKENQSKIPLPIKKDLNIEKIVNNDITIKFTHQEESFFEFFFELIYSGKTSLSKSKDLVGVIQQTFLNYFKNNIKEFNQFFQRNRKEFVNHFLILWIKKLNDDVLNKINEKIGYLEIFKKYENDFSQLLRDIFFENIKDVNKSLKYKYKIDVNLVAKIKFTNPTENVYKYTKIDLPLTLKKYSNLFSYNIYESTDNVGFFQYYLSYDEDIQSNIEKKSTIDDIFIDKTEISENLIQILEKKHKEIVFLHINLSELTKTDLYIQNNIIPKVNNILKKNEQIYLILNFKRDNFNIYIILIINPKKNNLERKINFLNLISFNKNFQFTFVQNKKIQIDFSKVSEEIDFIKKINPNWLDTKTEYSTNDYFNLIVFGDKNLEFQKSFELLYLFWWIDAIASGLKIDFLNHCYRLFPDIGNFIQKNYYTDFVEKFISG